MCSPSAALGELTSLRVGCVAHLQLRGVEAGADPLCGREGPGRWEVHQSHLPQIAVHVVEEIRAALRNMETRMLGGMCRGICHLPQLAVDSSAN